DTRRPPALSRVRPGAAWGRWDDLVAARHPRRRGRDARLRDAERPRGARQRDADLRHLGGEELRLLDGALLAVLRGDLVAPGPQGATGVVDLREQARLRALLEVHRLEERHEPVDQLAARLRADRERG